MSAGHPIGSFDDALRDIVRSVVREEIPMILRDVLPAILRAELGQHGAHLPAAGATGREKLLTVEDVANRLNVRPATVREWIQRGKLKAQRLGPRGRGRLYRVRPADLEAFLAVAPTAEGVRPMAEQAAEILGSVRAGTDASAGGHPAPSGLRVVRERSAGDSARGRRDS